MRLAKPTDHLLSVVCLSLGGTKLEIGCLTQAGNFFSSPELHWRESPVFSGLVDDLDVSRFCDALAQWISDFLAEREYRLSEAKVVGLPFPGPKSQGRWYSNNLIRAFQQGVDLEREMTNALHRLTGSQGVPAVRVIFDAQCDAGGELYHPQGRLASQPQSSAPTAMVLNVATGIAAGFIKDGRVLITDEDFRSQVDPQYDGGAGQLGRHLWYYPSEGIWKYHFQPHGQMPPVANSATRMTERLSGPALAARLLIQLTHDRSLSAENWTVPEIPFPEIEELCQTLALCDLASAAQTIRRNSRPVAAAVLEWADEVYFKGASPASSVESFANQVATEFADAIDAWMSALGWGKFGHRIILTGGAGMRFLASSDSLPERSFLNALEAALPSGCKIERSHLMGATERESYIFLHHPTSPTMIEFA